MANEKNLRPYSKGTSGNTKGRPPRSVPDHLMRILSLRNRKAVAEGLSRSEVAEWEEQLMTLNARELNAVANDADVPIYASALATAILIDMKCGRTFTLDKLRERRFGKVADSLIVTEREDLTQKSDEELMADIERLNNSLNE